MVAQSIAESQVYDPFDAKAVDPARWTVLELPRPHGRLWRCEDAGARTVAGEGTLDIHIEQFTRHHDQVQIFDDLKHQLISVAPFQAPAGGSLTFSIEIAATNLGSALGDWRDGQATFTVLDPTSGWSFRTFTTSHHIFATQEPMRIDSTASPRDLIGCDSSPLTVPAGVSHRHDVTFDADRRAITWRLDGTTACELPDREFPPELFVALGISSLQPIARGRSQSVHGQGLSASFGPLAVARTP